MEHRGSIKTANSPCKWAQLKDCRGLTPAESIIRLGARHKPHTTTAPQGQEDTMTALTALRSLSDNPLSAPIRTAADDRLDWFDAHVTVLDAMRRHLTSLMGHEGSGDGRGTPWSGGTLSGAVTATDVVASHRPRIRDSHDARSKEDRQSIRNYVDRDNPYGSDSAMREDIRPFEGMPAADKCGDVIAYRVPVWAVTLDHDQRRRMASRRRKHSAPLTRRDVMTRERRQAPTAASKQRKLQDALFAMAPTNGGDPLA